MDKKRYSLSALIVLTMITFTVGNVCAETKDIKTFRNDISSGNPLKPVSDMPLPQIIKLEDNLFQIGTIKINKKERFASIQGKINMSDGLVEYLACTPKGKLHESVLTLNAEPYHIQVALLLLGLAPGDKPIEFQGAPEKPCGDPLRITISWKENGKKVICSPEQLVLNIYDKKIMKKADWVFTGSKIMDGQYMAQVEGSIVAIYHDPFAIIDNRSIEGSDDTHFHANKNILPPVGTPIEFKMFSETDLSVKKRVRCETADN